MTVGTFRALAAGFLLLQAAGAAVWWIALLAVPAARPLFLPPGAPEAVLWSFVLPDLLLFAGGAAASASGIVRRRPWAWSVLCLHAGAALYAALYALSLPLLTGRGWA